MFEIRRHRQEGFHLREIQNDRKFPLGPGMPDLLHHPFPLQRRSVKKFEGGNIKPECSLGQMPFLYKVKQVRLELSFPQFFRGPVKIFCQIVHFSQVTLLRIRFAPLN